MKTKPNNLKTALGIVLVLLAIITLFFWEAEGRKFFLMDEVLISDEDVKTGEPINSEKISIVSIPAGTLVDGAITPKDSDLLSGKVAAVDIIKGSQLSSRYLRDKGDKPKTETSCFIIRNEWIFMCTSSLRRGDDVVIASADGRNVLGRYPVVFVKDSDGREVVNASSGIYGFTGTAGENERVNTSAPIHHVEIECGLNDYRKIIDYCSGKIGAPLMLIREIP